MVVMKVIFHEQFLQSYTHDPAASPGRLDQSYREVGGKYAFLEPSPCEEEDVLLAHTNEHYNRVKGDESVFASAKLAVGATIDAALCAAKGEPSFALCRPPGHHASPDHSWGFCYFNNIAIAVKKYLLNYPEKKILVVDFDLHYGDGTANIFQGNPAVIFYELPSGKGYKAISELKKFLEGQKVDMIACSAGFDRHVNDWGGMLTTSDYGDIGNYLGEYAHKYCENKIFAALEGGYNSRALAESIVAFLDGIEAGRYR